MNKTGGKIVLWGLIIGMLAYTATRTIHFLQLTFPPDQQYVAYLGLAAFDIGVLGWFYFATQSAEGTLQRVIAYGMIFICAGGVLATTITDMTLVSSQNGLTKIPKDIGTLGLWAVIIVISLDFLAGILAHLADPAHQKHFEMQNAKDVIHTTTMTHIKQQANMIAPQIAAQVSEYWARQVAAEMTGQIPGAKQPLQLTDPSNVVQGSLVSPTQASPPQEKRGLFGLGKKSDNIQQAVSHAQTTPTIDYDQLAQAIQRTQQSSPLQLPTLDAANQSNGNGKSQ